MPNYSDLTWDNPAAGVITAWKYEWSYIKSCMDGEGSDALTGLVLPTPSSSRTSAVESFQWHHLAPVVGFRITGSGTTVSITSIPEYAYTKSYPYDDGDSDYGDGSDFHPRITFSYLNASGSYITIAEFGGNRDKNTGNVIPYNGDYDNVTKTATVPNLEQAAIYATCEASACQLHGSQNFVGYIKLNPHTHIDKPDPPTITTTTGKTITVENGKDGLYCNTTNDGWYDTPYKFSGLTQGTTYSFKCREYCPDCPNDKVLESSNVSGKTWSITGSSSSGMGSLTFTATHTAGTNGDSSRTITYKLYTEKSTSSTLIGTKTSDSGRSVKFTDLDSNKTYYCHAYTTGITDNDCWISSSTKTPAAVGSNNGNVSATTLRASVSWSSGSEGVTTVCIVSCNGSSRSLSYSGQYVGFTGLNPGSTYTVSYNLISTYDIYDEEGEVIGTETIESGGSFSLKTKSAKMSYNLNSDITSKIIRFKSESIDYPSDTMEHKISPGDDWESVAQDTYTVYNNLNHNTSYTLSCRIAGCYAFDSSGNQTSVNDSILTTQESTKSLSLAVSISEEHQHSIVTLWQAYVDGVPTNSDAIDGTPFYFTYKDTVARKNNPPYQASEVIAGSNGHTSGDYQSDKKIYSNNLTWYYCEYAISASITDGYNIVANAIIAHTTFPYKWLNVNGQWHRAMPYIYTNGGFVPAPEFVYTNNKYCEPNGER